MTWILPCLEHFSPNLLTTEKKYYQNISHDLQKNGSNRKSHLLFAENYEKARFYQG